MKNSFGAFMPKKQSVRMLYKRFSRTGDTFRVIPSLKKRRFSTATDAIANIARNREFPNFLGRIACDRDSKSIIDRFLSFCLHPIYRSVVCTEAWPSRNWICSKEEIMCR